MTKIENIINHIVLVLDASESMHSVSSQLVKVADNQIKYLAQRSKDLDQETRVTVYTFGTDYKMVNNRYKHTPKIDCLIYDKDVLRVPSIAALYKTHGATPLIDATELALNDLALTPEKYGEHSFLVYVLTDGQENVSNSRPTALSQKINGLPDHWTVATFVPSPVAIHEAKRFGFPKENIAVWDATSNAGVDEVGLKMRQATDNYMVARASGVRGSKNLFSLETPSINIVASKITPLHFGQFRLYDVNDKIRIDEFVEQNTNRAYRRGEAYYQLSKTEKVQPQKQIAILGKGGLYTGPDARNLLGLPDHEVKVGPNYNSDYTIFVQSTSNNRNLMPNTKLLVLS